eukprot:scaffold3891_cov78-Cyclotella_meneghiniana.AAC.1
MPPPDRLINLVGFLNSSNGRKCADHTCCGIDLVANTPSGGAGILLRLVKTNPSEISAYVVLPDGNIGCRVGFAQLRPSANQLCRCLCARKLASPLTAMKAQTIGPPEQSVRNKTKGGDSNQATARKMRGGLHCSVRLMGVGAVCDGRDQWVVRSLVCV